MTESKPVLILVNSIPVTPQLEMLHSSKKTICRKVTTNKRQLKTLVISERVSGRRTLQQLILIVPGHPRTTILTGPHLIPSQFYADIFLFQEVSGLFYATFVRKCQKKGLEGDIPVNM